MGGAFWTVNSLIFASLFLSMGAHGNPAERHVAAPSVLHVATMAELKAMPSTRLSTLGAAAVYLDGYRDGSAAGAGTFTWKAHTSAVPDGGVWIAPADHPGTCQQGCLERTHEDTEANITWWGADPTGKIESTAAFESARSYLQLLPHGGYAFIPGGVYTVCTIDWSNSNNSQFSFMLGIRGAGPDASVIQNKAGCTNGPVINAAGRNDADYTGFTIICSNPCQAGLLLARTTISRNANGNRLTNINFGTRSGANAFTSAAIVSIAAENTLIDNVHMFIGDGPTGFWTGVDPAKISISLPRGQILLRSTNTGNVMRDTFIYGGGNKSRPVVFSGGAGWAMDGIWIIGYGDDERLATYTDCIGGYFKGPVSWKNSHFENYHRDPIAHYLDCGDGNNYFIGIDVDSSNRFGMPNGAALLDYDRRTPSVRAFLSGSVWDSPSVQQGATGQNIYLFGIQNSVINFLGTLGAGGTINILGFASTTRITAQNANIIQLVGGQPYVTTASSLPTGGTWPAGSVILNSAPTSGRPTGWAISRGGSFGILTGITGSIEAGQNELEVNSTNGLFVGARIAVRFADEVEEFVITDMKDARIYLDHKVTSSAHNAAIRYVAPLTFPMSNFP